MTGVQTCALPIYIVVPHLSSYLGIATVLGFVLILPTFGEIYATTGGGPGTATTTLAFEVYDEAFVNYQVGLASALALVDAVFVIIVATILVRMLGRMLTRGGVMQ